MKMKHSLFSRMVSLLLTAGLLLTLAGPGRVSALGQEEHAMTEPVRVSILLEGEAALDRYPAETVGCSAAANDYRAELRAEQEALTARIEAATGRKPEVVWNLTLAANLISANVRYGDIETIRAQPGVEDVVPEARFDPPDPVNEGEADGPDSYNTARYMVGAVQAWDAGYTGAGKTVAIIDSGVDYLHQSFDEGAFLYALEEFEEPPTLMTEADYSGLTLNGRGRYVSAKIPFGYNYIDKTNELACLGHMSDEAGEHGSHVAGIAGANRCIPADEGYEEAAETVCAVGMAPDAQVLIMKVFGAGGGAYETDYMAAVEDCITLGVDACNISIGSAAPGFTASANFQNLMNRLANGSQNTKLIVSISAGNSGAFTTQLDQDLYIEDVGLHTGGSPGTFPNSLCVASADNVGITDAALLFGERVVYYKETDSTGARMRTIPGDYGFVCIDGVGSAADYAAADAAVGLAGKVVIVNRGGGVSFSVKANNAIPYQPAALLVANNAAGTVSMNLANYTGSFPVVSITQADAQAIREASELLSGGAGTYWLGQVTVTDYPISSLNARNSEVSSFSSWGVPGSLIMKPEITAPGGNIYSVFGSNLEGQTVTGGPDRYKLMSGTSMASPHVTGLSVLLAQHLDEAGIQVPGHTRRQLVQSLLMSTAVPLREGSAEGPYYSILQQGAGMISIAQAIQARSAIFMEADATAAWADGKVKAELGDKPDRSGTYEYSFTLWNLAQVEHSFVLSTDLFTQGRYVDEAGAARMSLSTAPLDWEVSYSTGPTLTLAPGRSQTVHVTIAIPADHAAFDADYPCGAYVEGFTYVDCMSEGMLCVVPDARHSIPLLGFYGSWTDPSMFENTSRLDGLYGQGRTPYSGNGESNYLTWQRGGQTRYVTGNPYVLEEPFPAEKLALRTTDSLGAFSYLLIRAAGTTGTAVARLDGAGQVAAVLYAAVNGIRVSGMYYNRSQEVWKNTDPRTVSLNRTPASLGLTNGDRFRAAFYAIPEYYALADAADPTAAGAIYLDEAGFRRVLLANRLGAGAAVGYDFYADDEAPVIEAAWQDGDLLRVRVRDNCWLAWVALVSADGTVTYAGQIPQQTGPGGTAACVFDLTGLDLPEDFRVLAGDYAANETLAPCAPPEPTEDENLRLFLNLAVGIELETHVTVPKAVLAGYQSWQLEISKLDAAGTVLDSRLYDPATDNLLPETMSAWQFSYSGIVASELGMRVRVVIWGVDGEGVRRCSPVYETSFRDYILGELLRTTNHLGIRRLAADLLNYGAAAQAYFQVDADAPVNGDLSAEAAAAMAAFQTTEEPTAELVNTAAPGFFYNATLTNRVLLCVTARRDCAEAAFRIQDAQGQDRALLPASSPRPGVWQTYYDGLEARDMRSPFTITLLADGQATELYAVWSLEGYVREAKAAGNLSATELALYNAMLVYVDSVAGMLEE